MSVNAQDYGLLLNKDIKLHRWEFEQMVKLLGINCIYRAPRKDKDHDLHGELDTRYYDPQVVGVIFEEHPDQQTLKKRGWVAELQEGSSMIHVPYDLPHLEEGALFTVPSGLDNVPGRTFRIIKMQNIMIYPASIACEIALEYEDKEEQTAVQDFTEDNFTILRDLEDDD